MNMAEKITMRLEQFDSVEDGDITLSGPIQLLTTVSVFENLASIEDPEDGAVVYVENVTNEPSSLRYRGAYFSYRELDGEWKEILIGTHSHDNKEFLDRLGGVDFGEWKDLSENTNVFIQTTKPTTGLTNNSLFLNTTEEISLELYDSLTQTWTDITEKLTVTENYFTSVPKLGDYVYYKDTLRETPSQRLYIFFPIQKNEKKIFTLEVIDTDNTEATYEYNLNWQDLPEFDIPTVPTEDGKYLSYNSDKMLEWKNNFIAAQTFQIKNTLVEEDTTTVNFSDVIFDNSLDDVLVLAGKFFVYNIKRPIDYNQTTKVLTIELVSDENSSQEVEMFEAGETITVLIIRNGAASILDSLAKDYVTKSEAITLLTGGAVNLKDYLRKEDGLKLAKKYHTHSQFSRVGHDHDDRYALFKHTHSQYLTRKAAIALIEEQLNLHPDILTTLTAISNAIDSDVDLQTFLENVTAIQDVQAEIDTINEKFEEYYTKTQIDALFVNKKIRSDQVNVVVSEQDTNKYEFFRTTLGEPRDLTDILIDIKEDLDNDYGSIETDEVLLKESIEVKLGQGGFIGEYDNGETIEEGQTLSQIIKNLVQRDIIPTYIEPSISFNLQYNELSEIGETIDVKIIPVFIKGNSGGLHRITVSENGVTLFSSLNENEFDEIDIEVTLKENTELLIESSYDEGLPLYSNLGTLAPGRILEGDFEDETILLKSHRALFYGSSLSTETIDSSFIRSNIKKVLSSYTNFEVEYTAPIGSRFIVFAMPSIEAGTLISIHYKEQGNLDVTDLFNLTQVGVDSLEPVQGSVPLYNVYTLELPLSSQQKMTFTFKK
jgi:hypothetical protein